MLKQLFAKEKMPWAYLGVFFVALVIQLHPDWRAGLLYDRAGVAQGQLWRLWTGHLVHFGWPHFVADAGLFLILGRLLEREYPFFSRTALVAMPLVISLAMFWLDPLTSRYGGLSAVNIGLLLFFACRGWQRSWTDWFWPVVLLIYVGEVILEATKGHGHGGGMIQFDDPSIHVATAAHIVGSLYGLIGWAVIWIRDKGTPARTSLSPSAQ